MSDIFVFVFVLYAIKQFSYKIQLFDAKQRNEEE